MAKFLKSFFTTSDKRKAPEDDNKDFVPPSLDGRRKLSISRSGRMKQNKKRPSINQEIFNETQQKIVPELKEYHVHGKKFTETQSNNNNQTSNQQQLKLSQQGDCDKNTDAVIDNAFKLIETNF